MSNAKEIRTKIRSVESTKKITRAMEMVAASKMRKAQDRMRMSRPYVDRIEEVIKHISTGSLEYKHPFTIARETKKVGVIVISSDRGLCGGLNINLFKALMEKFQNFKDQNIDITTCTVGSKAFSFFSRFGVDLSAKVNQLGSEPHIKDLIGVIQVMLDKFDNYEIDEVWVAYNEFVNTMVQTPVIKKLLPITNEEKFDPSKRRWDYIYEPSPEFLLDGLFHRYIESLVYQAVVENLASEQAARMVAMKSATDNAGDLINEFKLLYNKARQAAITQELSEIVAGAAAV